MNILFLTDHSRHTQSNSLYPVVNSFREDSRVAQVFVCSRMDERNRTFFENADDKNLFGHHAIADLHINSFDNAYQASTQRIKLSRFDLIFLRIPRPLSNVFLENLEASFGAHRIVNKPSGIFTTSDKSYLANFSQWVPEIKLCHTGDDVMSIYNKFPVVLKPLHDYGGRGLCKIIDDKVTTDGVTIPLDLWLKKYNRFPTAYLAMKYLKNVDQGDKRIIVANGKIMGYYLRMPSKGNWLCNVAQGGKSTISDITHHEIEMVKSISPNLIGHGIFLYGLDTLVDDEGNRVISEINTLSVGGVFAVESLYHKRVSRDIVDELFKFIN
jgi:glutathione synthase